MPETHDGLPVAGYQPQPQSNIDIVNRNKQKEEEVLRMIDRLSIDPQIDQRWLAIAKTHIQTGFMAMNRAVFRPKRVVLAIDEAPSDDDVPF